MSEGSLADGPGSAVSDFVPEWHKPREWQPPNSVVLRFAKLVARDDLFCGPGIERPGAENWLRLATLVLQSDEVLAAFDDEGRDNLIFCLSFRAGSYSGRYEFGLLADFIETATGLYRLGILATLPDSRFMLFDLITPMTFRTSWSEGKPVESPYLLALQELLLVNMLSVLSLNDRNAHKAALHGLGHLAHDGARPAIEKFIEQTEDDELREYARAAWAFKIQ